MSDIEIKFEVGGREVSQDKFVKALEVEVLSVAFCGAFQ